MPPAPIAPFAATRRESGVEPTKVGNGSGFVTRLVLASIVALLLGLPWTGRAQTPGGIWTSASELASLPTSGKAWEGLLAAAQEPVVDPNVADQEDPDNVRVLARAL